MNWREIPAGLQLNRMIAERLGGKLHSLGRGDHNGTEWFTFIFPDGKRTQGAPYGMTLAGLPNYSTDANIAMTLIQVEGLETEIRIHEDDSIHVNISKHGRDYYDSDKNVALAICKAWLTWQDARETAHLS